MELDNKNSFFEIEKKQLIFLKIFGMDEQNRNFFLGKGSMRLCSGAFDLFELIRCHVYFQKEKGSSDSLIKFMLFDNFKRDNVQNDSKVQEIDNLVLYDVYFVGGLTDDQLERLDHNIDFPYFIQSNNFTKTINYYSNFKYDRYAHIKTYDENFYLMTKLSGGNIWF